MKQVIDTDDEYNSLIFFYTSNRNTLFGGTYFYRLFIMPVFETPPPDIFKLANALAYGIRIGNI